LLNVKYGGDDGRALELADTKPNDVNDAKVNDEDAGYDANVNL